MDGKAAKDLRERRERAGWSRARAAVAAGVTESTARAFELGGPGALKNKRKAEALVRVYARFGTGAAA